MRELYIIDPGDSDEQTQAIAEELNYYTLPALHEIAKDNTSIVSIEGDRRVKATVLMPRDADTSRWNVLTLPFANVVDEHMVLRGLAVQWFAGEADHPTILLPNNSLFNRAYSLTKEEKSIVSQHNPWPIADQFARVIEKITHSDETPIDIFGYSQGAMVAPFLGGLVNARSVISAEAPNAEKSRDEATLKKAFIGKGTQNLKAMNRAILDTEIKALKDSMAVKADSPKVGVTQLVRTGMYGLGGMFGHANKALHSAMSGDGHIDDLEDLMHEQPDVKLTIAKAAASAILSAEGFVAMQKAVPNAYPVLLNRYGHEAGDNILVMGRLARYGFDTVHELAA